MDVYEAIRTRQSIRRYRPDPVPDEVLNRVLDAMRLAPSAGNLQPWRFVVVRDAATRERLAKATSGQEWIAHAPLIVVACGWKARAYSKMGGYWSSVAVDVTIAFDHLTLAAAAEWPGWRGPNRDGTSPNTGLLKEWPADGPQRLWEVNTIGKGFSSVAVSGGPIYITGIVDGNLVLFAFDTEGKPKWRTDCGAVFTRSYPGARSTPMIDNGKLYDSKKALLTDADWHCVEAMFKLNSLDAANDKWNADGELRGWFDGKLVIERTDIIFRTTDFPRMKLNQFLLAPYFGRGLLPHAQKLWIDELAVGTQRIGPLSR